MAKINKQAVMQKLIDELQLYPGKDVIPTELAEKILAVYQINAGEVDVQMPTATVVKTGVKDGAAGATTIYTTPATGKFYLTNAVLASSVDMGNFTSARRGTITVTIDGVAVALLTTVIKDVAAATLDRDQVIVVNLQNPLLIDPATNITVTADDGGSYNTGSIVGYTTD